MNDFLAGVLRLLLRLLVVAMGVVLFVSLLAAVIGLGVAWAVRSGWARLTGKTVTPWVMRMDPRTGFSTVFRSGERWPFAARTAPGSADAAASQAPVSRRGAVLPGSVEVTDVEAREVR